MALTLDSSFLASLQGQTTALTRVWTITRTDGQVYRFTEHDEDLVYNGNTYEATTLIGISSIKRTSRGEAQTADMNIAFSASGVSYDDMAAGLFRKALVEIRVVNHLNLALPGPVVFYGKFGPVKLQGKLSCNVSLTGRLDTTLNTLGELYSPECRARLGDARCKVDIESFKTTGTVKSVDNNRKFTVEFAVDPDNSYYSLGEIVWTTGNNAGLRMEVLDQFAVTPPDDQLLLALNMPKTVQVGDTFTIYAGCDQRPTTCRDKFNNKVNYRGEDFLSGPDKIRDVPRFEEPTESTTTPINSSGYGSV
jgi:uncharacterized phage protein (TIGR02218 family)